MNSEITGIREEDDTAYYNHSLSNSLNISLTSQDSNRYLPIKNHCYTWANIFENLKVKCGVLVVLKNNLFSYSISQLPKLLLQVSLHKAFLACIQELGCQQQDNEIYTVINILPELVLCLSFSLMNSTHMHLTLLLSVCPHIFLVLEHASNTAHCGCIVKFKMVNVLVFPVKI